MADYSTLLREHVTLTCRSIDRIFLQAWVPKLQSVGQVCIFLRWQKGFKIPSSAAFGSLIDAAAAEGGDGRVVLIGIAQEKASVWRSWKAKGQEHAAHPHMEWGRQMAFINHFYFYLWDPDWGPAFWKTNAYAPYPVWLWLNGHEWAKRQLERAGLGYEALDNGFRSCDDPAVLQKVCDRLGPGAVKAFFWRWQRRLPSPFTTTDVKAGYVYDLAFRQFEISDTRVFDRRIMPKTRGTFRTRVVTKGVDPQLSIYYKSSRLKQYFKEQRALRTETVIGDTRDFGIGRRVCAENWHALRAVGESANRRLCDAEAADASPAPDVATFLQVTRPTIDNQGLHAPGLRFGEPRVMALLAALASFAHLVAGFSNAQLVTQMTALLDAPYTPRQATYDLRRLRRKGLIVRQPGRHRYELTTTGRRVAVLFTKTYGCVLTPGLAHLDPKLPGDIAERSDLAVAWRRLNRTLDHYIDAGLAAA